MSGRTRQIKVLLADDHRIMCDGLRLLLERCADICVIGVATDGRAAVCMTRDLEPDVVIMDVAMPELNGIEATRQIRTEHPDTRVIALSMYADRRSITGMLKAGAIGYLLKDCAAEELAGAIRSAVLGRSFLSAEVASLVVGEYTRQASNESPSVHPRLTPRENEVLQLIAEGRTSAEIADSLHTSRKTIETHRRNIMEKLGVKSVAELTKYALREGLTSL